ncbi:MAG: 1-deoxy-D-xylulose-5-phosphate reductoisomerase [Bacteroidales bacterium]|nr:1-deoxy-D-xylulose-5-phosphate reductoisomerase [Bacteroidales bacterium]
MPKSIAILGSTGSIGKQCLDVIRQHHDLFSVEILSSNTNAELLINQAVEFIPNAVVIADEKQYNLVKTALEPLGIKVFAGEDSLPGVACFDTVDMVLSALVGFAGFKPTLAAIRAGKQIALANKETLVVGGELIMEEVMRNRVSLLPVDSEHSAIFQCLVGEQYNPVEKLILTGSGGPFRGKKRQDLLHVTPAQALKHPTWNMGAKITIDSASLMNKGLEVIEARWLFGIPAEKLEVVIHPQSIIHSIVQFEDGSMKAQMGLPDMRLPIQYALAFPQRLKTDYPRFNFATYPTLTFEPPDLDIFRNLALAYEALNTGGNAPCVLNAANEVAVDAFLNGKIGFLEMSDLIEKCLSMIEFSRESSFDTYQQTDAETRRLAKSLLKHQ